MKHHQVCFQQAYRNLPRIRPEANSPRFAAVHYTLLSFATQVVSLSTSWVWKPISADF